PGRVLNVMPSTIAKNFFIGDSLPNGFPFGCCLETILDADQRAMAKRRKFASLKKVGWRTIELDSAAMVDLFEPKLVTNFGGQVAGNAIRRGNIPHHAKATPATAGKVLNRPAVDKFMHLNFMLGPGDEHQSGVQGGLATDVRFSPKANAEIVPFGHKFE